MPGHLQDGFGCVVTNRFDQLLDDESDPFDILKAAENRRKDAAAAAAATKPAAAQAARQPKKESQKERKNPAAERKEEPQQQQPAAPPLRKDGMAETETHQLPLTPQHGSVSDSCFIIIIIILLSTHIRATPAFRRVTG